ncbi:hypothetical protein VNI00_013268 [Paramarasmius palmivorus]|uniref:Uncharacterized protein n=1 Tax=Paramarasmius palmivorus TaxID=297713 RepID=A0AAW0C2I9_9AGAR
MFPLPCVRQIVALRMDPVESVAHLDNPELTAACQNICTKSYIGWVFSSHEPVSQDLPYQFFTFYLLHQGLRPADEIPGSSPEMSIPVLPNTKHPLARQPLDPGRPLPWDDCYVSFRFHVGGRCPTIVLPEEPSNLYQTSIEETTRVGALMNEDNQKLESMIKQASDYSCEQLNEERDSSSALEGKQTNDNLRQDLIPFRSTPGGELDDRRDVALRNNTRLTTYPRRESTNSRSHGWASSYSDSVHTPVNQYYANDVVLKTLHDLTAVNQVNDPAGFLQELESFRRLVQEFETDPLHSETASTRSVDEVNFSDWAERQSQGSPVIPEVRTASRIMQRLQLIGRKSKSNSKPETKPNTFREVIRRIREVIGKGLEKAKGMTGMQGTRKRQKSTGAPIPNFYRRSDNLTMVTNHLRRQDEYKRARVVLSIIVEFKSHQPSLKYQNFPNMGRIPSIGHLVLLKMDPVEAVAHLENPELTSACQKMCTKTYVAWVYEPGVWGGPELPYAYNTVYILHRGLRPEGEKPGITPDMSIPVLPNTVHPLDRQPLDLGKPLPWDDCYISIGYSIGGRFPTIYSDESPLHRTTSDEIARVGDLIDEDLYVRRRPYGLNSNDGLELHEIPIGDANVPVDNIWDVWDGSETDWSDSGSVRVATPLESNINSTKQDAGYGCDIPGSSIAPVQQVNELPMSEYASSGTARNVHEIDHSYMHKAVFRVSYDLDSVDVLNDPTELIKELETFYRYVIEYLSLTWARRELQATRRTPGQVQKKSD